MTSHARPSSFRRSAAGFTLIELLIVMAILGAISGVAFVSGRQILRGQQEQAAINTVQQSIWQGATAAASRGIRAELFRNGTTIQVRNSADLSVIRAFDLPANVTFNLPEGVSLLFTPPGKIDIASLDALPKPLTLVANDRTYELQISLIGEVKAEGS